jgi:hypothetical protein
MAMSSALRLLSIKEIWLLEVFLMMVNQDLHYVLNAVPPLFHVKSNHSKPFHGGWWI